jgi:tetratricopeptide (TPR) repeat protein
VALCILIYRPALEGRFLSDDYGYIVTNEYTSDLSHEHVAEIVDPRGSAKFYTGNYAPIHLLLTAAERKIFANDVRGYHLVNVGVHAINSVLLVALLLASGIPVLAAVAGGLWFTTHPANVEAVAWISQLKTNGALAFSLGALLALRRHPALATLLFAAALLTKASATAALPAAAAFTWARAGTDAGSRRHWIWLAGWALIFGLYSIPQTASFAHMGSVDVPAYDDPMVHLRSIAAVGERYLVMAATAYGVSAFQEPPPALSWFDPWWLAAIPTSALLGWRLFVTLRSRSEEAGWWVLAAASFVPVSQFFPFLHPVADRYLYFILPGLIGGVLLAALDLGRVLEKQSWTETRRRALARGALAASVAVSIAFAVGSAARAKHWRNEALLLVDAARHYPDGGSAHYLRARAAAQAGDATGAVSALRAAVGAGMDNFTVILRDPAFAPIHGQRSFQEFSREIALAWIERARERGAGTQADWRMVARAHLVREEYAEAIVALERAVDAGGPLEPQLRIEIEQARMALERGGY